MGELWKPGIGRRAFFLTGLAAAGQGWEPLFDGRSTAGWIAVNGGEFPAHSWKVEDGCLRTVVVKPTFQDIRTEREFGDFELAFEWKIAPGGNCGVKYLIDKYDSWMPPGVTAAWPQARARGYEYQLTDDERSAETKRDASRGTASVYSKIAPEGPPLRAAGEWNDSRIVVNRPVVEHWLNGKKVVTAAVGDGAPRRSAIALQNHQSECWFRGIRVRV